MQNNRRRTIVINKKFQYQYSLLIAALAVLLVNGFLIVRMLMPGSDPLDLSSGDALAIALVEIVLVGGIWYASLRASHRIAGPVYVFSREFNKLGQGDLTARINLRDKDMFRPEAEQINKSLASLSTRIVAAKGLSEQLKQAHGQGSDIGPLIDKLAAELDEFTLGDDE